MRWFLEAERGVLGSAGCCHPLRLPLQVALRLLYGAINYPGERALSLYTEAWVDLDCGESKEKQITRKSREKIDIRPVREDRNKE
jgi:hypothetical protein